MLLPATTAAEAERLGARARGALEIGFSFGVSERAAHGADLDELLRSADARLYADKKR